MVRAFQVSRAGPAFAHDWSSAHVWVPPMAVQLGQGGRHYGGI